ncbi:hypothetical protein [Pseudomonas sp. NPDC088444]|uniref:hypothetical protein n=1 Tax=Pseudomonas sp. NPDC088444 TaxID=3364456 RepID=UPI0038515711
MAAGELLSIASAILLFGCAVPVTYLLLVEALSQAYSFTAILKMFFGAAVMLLWWSALLAGLLVSALGGSFPSLVRPDLRPFHGRMMAI